VHEVSGTFDGVQRTLSRIEGYGNAYLDNYLAIRPKFALSADVNQLYLNFPIQVVGGPERPVTRAVRSATGGGVLDLAISPEGTRHPYLVAGCDAVWQIDSITGTSSRLATVDHPRRLVFGGADQSLYVLTDGALVRLGRDGRLQSRTTLKMPLDAIAYDERHDTLVGVSVAALRLFFFDHDLHPAGQAELPAQLGVSLADTAGGERVSLAAAPDGSLLLHRDGATDLFALGQDGRGLWQAEKVTLQGAGKPQALSVDDQGHLFVTDGGTLVEFGASGRPVEGSKFTGLPGGQVVDVLRHFTNFDAKLHTGPAYANVLPQDAVPPTSVGAGGPVAPGPQKTPTPITDVTNLLSIQIGTLRQKHGHASPSTEQLVTLTNIGGKPINGPFFLLVEGLRKNTRLKNARGFTAMHIPGTPFVSVDLGTLAPGGRITLKLVFRGRRPHYTPAIFAGLGTL
jgi:hypothetical protein